MKHSYPKYFADRIFSNEEALAQTVKSGTYVASGFATSEPHTFYATLWDHIKKHELTDINIRNALFLAPHKLLVGDAMSAKGVFRGTQSRIKSFGMLHVMADKIDKVTQKLDGLGRLIDHFKELQERRIKFVSAFLSPAQNMIIPTNPITKALYPDFVGRNPSRMGIVDMQSVHFPDAPDSLAYHQDGSHLFGVAVGVATPPNEKGEMSLGLANGATMGMFNIAKQSDTAQILIYLNPKYPFTRGWHDSPNTINVSELKGMADQGRLFVVEDPHGKLPSFPAGSFANPAAVEVKIAENVVNHMEMNRQLTHGRAIQVGLGGTGVLAIKALKNSSWKGRMYTEMLEPFTLDLWDAGKIAGTHFIEKNGTRTMADGKMVCTFAISEEGTNFYQRLHNNDGIIVSEASRVVVQEAFYYGLGINNILSVDFQGHVNSGGRDVNHYSGVGGGATIMRGLGKGGVGYLCLKSTHTTPDGELRSSIFPFQPAGTPLSLIGPDLMGTREGAQFFLVTEHGVAKINAMSQGNFIKNIISVSDPKFRDWLCRMAWEEFRVKC
jgi:acyl-CoA hydrolase